MNTKSLRQLSPKELDQWLQSDLRKPVVIDVREDEELEIASFSYTVMHLPLSRSSEFIGDLRERLMTNQQIVVICHSGIRSTNFALWLIDQGWGLEVWNLDGGIDAWSLEIDAGIARY